MLRRLLSFGFVVLFLTSAALGIADDVKPVSGTLLLGKSTYQLAHVMAYESKEDDEAQITVLASDRKLPAEMINSVLKKDNGSDRDVSLNQPYVKIVFDKSGKISSCKGSAMGTQFSTSGDDLKGELKLDASRVTGQAKLATQGEGEFVRNFELQFDVTLGSAASVKKPARPAGPVKPLVTGTFKGNGKPAKLAFISAHPGQPFDDKPSIVLVLTEKDHSKVTPPDQRAAFGDFGSALIISLHEDGQIFGCEVAHLAHSKRPFSSSGTINATEFDVDDGQITGHITSAGEHKFFDETWDIDVKFTVPYTAPAPKVVAKDSPTNTKPSKPTAKPSATEPRTKTAKADPKKAALPADAIDVKDLPLPKDASDVEYKKLVEHMSFQSKISVQQLTEEFAKRLAAQGWESDGKDLITPKSSILKRTRNAASLTIFVKPAGTGSKVTIMSKGLNWAEK